MVLQHEKKTWTSGAAWTAADGGYGRGSRGFWGCEKNNTVVIAVIGGVIEVGWRCDMTLCKE